MTTLLLSNKVAHEDAITSILWTDTDYIVTASLDELLRVWNPSSLLHPVFTSAEQDMAVVDLCSLGNNVISSSMDGILRSYQVDSDIIQKYQSKSIPTIAQSEVEAGPGMSWKVSLLPTLKSTDDSIVATGTKSGGVLLYNMKTGELHATLNNISQTFTLNTKFSPDGKWLLTTHQNGSLQIFATSTGICKSRLIISASPLRALAISQDSNYFAVGDDEGKIYIYSLVTLQKLGVLLGHFDRITCLEFAPLFNIDDDVSSPQQRMNIAESLISASLDRTVISWSLTENKKATILPHNTQQIWSMAISPDRKKIAFGFDDGELGIYALP